MTPVSLIFFSVPVSSSAPAWFAPTIAASAIPNSRRLLVRISFTPTLSNTGFADPCKDRAVPAMLHDFIGIRIGGVRRVGEFMPELGPHRHVEVQPLRRNLLHEPLVVK